MWCSSNPITEAISILDYLPLMCLICYVVSLVFSSCPLSPTSLSILLHSPFPCLLMTAPLHPLVLSPPVPTISDQPRPPTSVPSSHRGPESAALQFTVQPCSASLIYKPLSPQSPPPPSLPPEVGIHIPPPPVYFYVHLLSTLQLRVGSFLGTVPFKGSAPTPPNRIAAPPVPPP